ncbi:MAG: glycosyltransferase family 4 protein [Gaiellaceae bacterium]
MQEGVRLLGAFLLAGGVVLIATPLAISVAIRAHFFDTPRSYKAHLAPTPYLGGAAVVLGILGGSTFVASEFGTIAPIVVGAGVLWVVGTVDDRRGLSPLHRLIATAAAAVLLAATGLGWSVFGNPVADALLTVFWVIAVVNAMNLMDNMDGAASAVAGVSAAGIAIGALIHGDLTIAILAIAVCGATLSFLRYNLSVPARIFLGDGGTMSLGFVLAAGVLALDLRDEVGTGAPVPAVLLVGLPAFDTTLVVISRLRRHVTVWVGGRDHTTHRIGRVIRSPRKMAALLALTQSFLCGAALFAYVAGANVALATGAVFAGVFLVAGVLLERVSPLAPVRLTRAADSSKPTPRPVTTSARSARSMPYVVREATAPTEAARTFGD